MKSRFVPFLFASSCILLGTSHAVAKTIHYVDNLGNCDLLNPCHATITEAVDAAAPSDIIEVFPGVYNEAVVFGVGKDRIVLRARGRTRALMPVIAVPAGAHNGVTLIASGVQVRQFIIEAPEGLGVFGNGILGSTGAVIQGNLIRARDGILFTVCRFSAVRENWVLGGPIVAQINSANCSIEGNTVDGASGGVSIRLGGGDHLIIDNIVRRNLVRGGDILLPFGEPLTGNIVEANQVQDGDIVLSSVDGGRDFEGNVIRRNVVRGGGIELGAAGSDVLGTNLVEANFVSGSPADGIAILAAGGTCIIRKNTSVENTGCDINDTAVSGNPQNTWTQNRFVTSCGAATD